MEGNFLMVTICVSCGYSYRVDKIYFRNAIVCLLALSSMHSAIDTLCVSNNEIPVVLGFGPLDDLNEISLSSS